MKRREFIFKSTFAGFALSFTPLLGASIADAAPGGHGGVLFYAGFEGNGVAIAHGDGTAQMHGAPRFVAGRRGQALLSGDDAGYLSYAVDKNIFPDRGSIEFWFQAQDWKGDDNFFHVFFEAGNPGWMVLYKYGIPREGLSGLFLLSAAKKKWNVAKQDFGEIKPGEWHQLVATWSRSEAFLYLDGKASAKLLLPPLPQGLNGRFTVGDISGLSGEVPPVPRHANSLIDEFYIYDRPLTSAEVQWTYQRSLDRVAGDDTPEEMRQKVLLWVTPQPAKNQLQAEVQVSGIDRFKGTARLVPSSVSAPFVLQLAGERSATALLPIADLPGGDYTVEVTVKNEGEQTIGTAMAKIELPGPPEWRDNKIGISTTPPPPWTPLEIKDPRTISCWNRTYYLNALGLPEQIDAGGEKLLQSPIILRAANGTEEIEWTPSSEPKLVHANAMQVVLEGASKSTLGVLNWKCTIEFDGMMRYELTLEPGADAAVDRLEMRVPVAAEIATLRDTLEPSASIWNKGRPGANEPQQGTLFQNRWSMYWWLGSEDRGLAGWCENDAAWNRIDRVNGFRIERTPASVDAVWSFVAEPHTFNTPWKFIFALQATPVKAMRADRRRWRLVPFTISSYASTREWWKISPENKNVQIIWPTPDTIKYYGYPEATDSKLKATADDLRAQGLKPITYTLINAISSAAPEARFYGDAWRGDYASGSADFSDVAQYSSTIFNMSPTKDWADFIVWKTAQFIQQNDLDGLYHDLTHVLSSSNLNAGFGYVRDGKVRPSYPIFGMREVYKRVYTMLKDRERETGRETFMMSHMSTNMVIPILGFSDAYLDGENFQSEGVKDDYLDFITLAGLRAEFIGTQYGVMPFFLPELAASGNQTAPTRHLIGLSLLHDFALWPIWLNVKEYYRIWQTLDAFNINDAQLLPYWDNVSVIGGQNDAVKCSVYRNRKNGKPSGTLLCIVNTTRQTHTATLNIDWSELMAASHPKISDALDDKPVISTASTLEVEVAPLDFRLVRVE